MERRLSYSDLKPAVVRAIGDWEIDRTKMEMIHQEEEVNPIAETLMALRCEMFVRILAPNMVISPWDDG